MAYAFELKLTVPTPAEPTVPIPDEPTVPTPAEPSVPISAEPTVPIPADPVTTDEHTTQPTLVLASSLPAQCHSNPPPLSPVPHILVAARQQEIGVKRKSAREAQVSQAERMVKRSLVDLKSGDIGDNVAVPIRMVNKGRGDPKNILGVIIDRNENDLYTIGVKAGVLKTKYTIIDFNLCPQRLIGIADINQDERVSLREALKKGASGGQGHLHCSCASSGSKK